MHMFSEEEVKGWMIHQMKLNGPTKVPLRLWLSVEQPWQDYHHHAAQNGCNVQSSTCLHSTSASNRGTVNLVQHDITRFL